MPFHTPNWLFNPNFNLGTDSVFVLRSTNESAPFPPTSGYIITESVGSNNVITEDGNFTITE